METAPLFPSISYFLSKVNNVYRCNYDLDLKISVSILLEMQNFIYHTNARNNVCQYQAVTMQVSSEQFQIYALTALLVFLDHELVLRRIHCN